MRDKSDSNNVFTRLWRLFKNESTNPQYVNNIPSLIKSDEQVRAENDFRDYPETTPYHYIRAIEFYYNRHELTPEMIANYKDYFSYISDYYPDYELLEFEAFLAHASLDEESSKQLLTRAREKLPNRKSFISEYANQWLEINNKWQIVHGPVSPKGWLSMDVELNSTQYSPNVFWGEFRLKIFERDGFRCTDCGSGKDLKIVRVLPFRRGGNNAPKNLKTLCTKCLSDTAKNYSDVEVSSSKAGSQLSTSFSGNYLELDYSTKRGAPKHWEITNIDLNNPSLDKESWWWMLRQKVWNRDDFECQYENCRNEDWPTVHHIIPLSIKGTNRMSNLQTLCRTHHEQIHGRKIYNTGREFTNLGEYARHYRVSKKVNIIDKAIKNKSDLSIDYSDAKTIHTHRLITPLLIFVNEGSSRKYVRAYCHLRNAERTFRLARMNLNNS